MSPDERDLLENTLKLAKDNNRMLRSIQSTMHWGQVWGFIKILIIIVPFIIGYFYLQPYLGPIGTSIDQAKELFQSLK